MLALAYILLASLAGMAALQRLFPEWPPIAKLAGGFTAGVVVTAWISFALAWGLSYLTGESIVVGVVVATLCSAGVLVLLRRDIVPQPFGPFAVPAPSTPPAKTRRVTVRIDSASNDQPEPGSGRPLALGDRRSERGLGIVIIAGTMIVGILLFSMTAAVAMTLVMAICVAGWYGLLTIRFSEVEVALVFLALMFSFWLMDVRISGEPLTVSLNAWGDTSFHLAILRSFSWGKNYPPQFPFFGGNSMLYHFGIDYYAASLERSGLPVEWALNMPGALGFAAMMAMVFEIARALFNRIVMGIVAVILLITNGSLAFKDYWNLHHHSLSEAINSLWSHNIYIDIGPYSTGGPPSKVALYWTLNVFMTQTQLIVGMAAVLLSAYGVIRALARGEPLTWQKGAALGAVMGLMFWINGVLYVPAMVFFAAVFFAFGHWRLALRMSPAIIMGLALLIYLGAHVNDSFYKVALFYSIGVLVAFSRWEESLPFLIPAGGLGLPQAVWLNGGLGGGNLGFHTGYLVDNFRFDRLSSYGDFVNYWWLNLGVSLPLMIIAAFWAPAKTRRVMLAIMAIFVFGNFVALGRDLGGHNHKVFNLWEIMMNVFVAFAFVSIWNLLTRDIRLGELKLDRRLLNYAARAVMPIIFFFMILSGIIDFMTLKNDPRFEVFGDRAEASDGSWVPSQHGGEEAPINWIHDHTPGDAMFLNVYGDTYPIPTLAGRQAFFSGFEPWSNDKGYVTDSRRQEIIQIYNSRSKAEICGLVTKEGIDYILMGPGEVNGDRVKPDVTFFAQSFVAVYQGQLADGPITIYDVAKSCGGAAAAAAPG